MPIKRRGFIKAKQELKFMIKLALKINISL